MMDYISVNDELQLLKKRAKELGKNVKKIEKIGNGNMSAFRLYYTENNEEEMKEQFFWRHDLEKLIEVFEKEYHKKIEQ